jgi:hypothetical protein
MRIYQKPIGKDQGRINRSMLSVQPKARGNRIAIKKEGPDFACADHNFMPRCFLIMWVCRDEENAGTDRSLHRR